MKKIRNCRDILKSISKNIKNFCSFSTIGALKFLAANNSLIEKIWWFISIVLSVSAGFYLLNSTYTKWKNNPIIVSFQTSHTSVYNIPFPAVTVCPLNKIDQYKLNYSLILESPKILELNDLRYINQFWDVSMTCGSNLSHIQQYTTVPDFASKDFLQNIYYVSSSKRNTISNIAWRGEKTPYYSPQKSLFKPVVTSEGVCFSFNTLSWADMYTDKVVHENENDEDPESKTGWTLEDGYVDNDIDAYPYRTNSGGLSHGLSFWLSISTLRREPSCGISSKGFKVVFHNPAEIPRLSEKYFLIPSTKKVIVSVNPELIKTSDNLINYSVNKRNCYFSHEKNLLFFKTYTLQNCKMECLINITKQHCGCVPFYLPRDPDAKICGYGLLNCANEVQNLFFKFEDMSNKKQTEFASKTEKKEFKLFQNCKCLQSCTSLDFKVHISHAEFLPSITPLGRVSQVGNEISPVFIFYKNSEFLALERIARFSASDFLAKIGEILSLFIGFSVQSFMEIIYFIVVVLWFGRN